MIKIYIECPECGKIVTGKVPKGGDGSCWNPYSHNNPRTNEKCTGCIEQVDDIYKEVNDSVILQ